MALNSAALMLPGQGYILINDPGSQYEPTIAELEAFAADTTRTPKGSSILGHTSREDLVAMSRDGGDSDVLGSWEQEQIETVTTTAAIEYIDVIGHQFDNSMFDLYYGGGDSSQAGRYAVPKNAVPPKRSVTIVYLTRGQVVGQFFPNTSVRGEDAMEHSVDAWSTVPLRFTILDPADGGSRQIWIGRQFGAGAGPVDPPPAVTSLSPNAGPESGGQAVTITGTNLAAATSVRFGGTPAPGLTLTGSQLVTVTTPAGTPGVVDVVVTTPAGTSAPVSYTYEEDTP